MRSLFILTIAISACAGPDSATGHDGSTRDLAPRRDLATALDFATESDLACPIGTADSCGTCGMVCPPGMDDDATLRVCTTATSSGTCDIQCKAEYYDVNGLASDGCEANDSPVRDNSQEALTVILPDTPIQMNFNQNPRNLEYPLYSDMRTHVEAPAQRPNGLENWFSVEVDGSGGGLGMQACLSITSLPADNTFEVCISDIGQTIFDPSSCATVQGGKGSMCVYPPAKTNAGNPYYIRVRKTQGTPSLDQYALFMQH